MTVATESDVQRITREYVRALSDLEHDALTDMARRWARILDRVERELKAVEKAILRAIAEGKVPGAGPESPTTFSYAWLLQRHRLEALRIQVEDQVRRAVAATTTDLARLLTLGAELGVDMGGVQLASMITDHRTLSRSAIEAFGGSIRQQSPLFRLLDQMPGDMGRRLAGAILEGIGSGLNPREMARRWARAVGGNLYRGTLITRTETLRSFREGARATYRENAGVVVGTVWLSARNARTCAACWAMDGQTFPLEEELVDHPNGRCTFVPRVANRPIPLTSRNDAFSELSASQQRRVLGEKGYAAFASGRVSLGRFATIHNNPLWGSHPRVATLADLGLRR